MLRDLLADTVGTLQNAPPHHYNCPDCRDTGALTAVIEGRRYSQTCSCMLDLRQHIPRPAWQLQTLEQLFQQPGPITGLVLIDAASFARTGQGILIITGPYANRLAVAIGNAMPDAGRPHPCFFRAQTITNDLEINFRSNYPRYTTYPGLIIVRAPSYEAMREREANNFMELIEYRTDSAHVTVIATDYNHYPIPHAGHLDTGYIVHSGSVPADMASSMTFDSITPASRAMLDTTQQVRSWASQPKGWLYLSGGPGTGKTHLTVAAITARQRTGDSIHFQTAADLIDNLRTATAQSHQMYQHALDTLIDSDCLAIDDLGTARDTAFAQEQFFKILNARYETRRPTIINSNHSPERLTQDNPRIASRLRDQNLVTHIRINAPDYRVHGDTPQDEYTP